MTKLNISIAIAFALSVSACSGSGPINNIPPSDHGSHSGHSGPDNSGPDNSGPDNSGPDNSGPDNSGPDNSGPDSSANNGTQKDPAIIDGKNIKDQSFRGFLNPYIISYYGFYKEPTHSIALRQNNIYHVSDAENTPENYLGMIQVKDGKITTVPASDEITISDEQVKFLNKILPKKELDNYTNKDAYYDYLNNFDHTDNISWQIPVLKYTKNQDLNAYTEAGWDYQKSMGENGKELSSVYGFSVDKEGPFKDIPVYKNVFSRIHPGKVEEERQVKLYQKGTVSGLKQAYTMLYTWQQKDGKYNVYGVREYATDEFGYDNYNGVNDTPYIKGLKATYSGPAYTTRTGKQDGNLTLNAHFYTTENEGKNTYHREITGKITNRKEDDGRDIEIASTAEYDEWSDRARSVNNNIPLTASMKGKYPGEDRIITGAGELLFAGPELEEVVGTVGLTTHYGVNNIGFIGKRDLKSKKPAN